MYYLVNVLDDASSSNPEDERAAVDAFNDELQAKGYRVFAAGLTAPDEATVIDNRSGHPMVTDGPFLESNEHVAGLWIWEVPDEAVALDLAQQASRACNRRIELRRALD